jgi:tetratricopeptide (TPR) repeat protein
MHGTKARSLAGFLFISARFVAGFLFISARALAGFFSSSTRHLAEFILLMRRCTTGLLLLSFLLLGGCAGFAPQTDALNARPPADLPRHAEIRDVPFFPQDEYNCGPASLAMALNAAGVKITSDALVKQVYLPGRKGSLQVEMLAAARRNGRVAYLVEPDVTAALREVAAGTPVIVLENFGALIFPLWHYSVVVGYDLRRNSIIRHNGNRMRAPGPLRLFEFFWQKEGRWAMVAVPPERVPATATEQRYAAAVAALERMGQKRNAHIAYESLLKRWPTSLAGLMGSGNTAYAMANLPFAERRYQQAVAAHPASVAALNNLAQTLLDRGKLDEALRPSVQWGWVAPCWFTLARR